MPLPMVHLSVAMEIHNILEMDPDCVFLLGSIAPDAIHMRPGASPTDKQRVHLFDGGDPENERVRALLFEYGAKAGLKFAAGYAAHLLTDRLWEQALGLPFRDSFPAEFDPKVRRTIYYQETDQIDFDLYHQAPWRGEVWAKLKSCEPRDFAGLLSAQEITAWRERNLNWDAQARARDRAHPHHSRPG